MIKKLQIEQNGEEGLYLGFSESFGGSKVYILGYLKEKLNHISLPTAQISSSSTTYLHYALLFVAQNSDSINSVSYV